MSTDARKSGEWATGIQLRAGAWRMARYPDSIEEGVLAKLVEEVGELARAVIGRLEERPGRGDVGQEAAQVLLVMCSLFGRWYPDEILLRHPGNLSSKADPLVIICRLAVAVGRMLDHSPSSYSRLEKARPVMDHVWCLHRRFCPTGDLLEEVEIELVRGETALVESKAGEVYKPEGVAIWMAARNKLLEGERPVDLIARGECSRVLGLIDALCDGIVT